MSMTIAVAGKGGTGKTTIAALLAKFLATKGTVLAVDADPSVNLHMALGLPEPETVGSIREELLKAGGSVSGMSRHDYIELRAREAMVESEGLDLLAMGRPEGPGCYCPANYVLRLFLDRLTEAYDYVVIDNEAGMEHISRQTSRDIHTMLLVSDPTVRGITAAGRAQALLKELGNRVSQTFLVINRVSGELSREIQEAIAAQELKLLALAPADPAVGELDAHGKPVTEIPPDSPLRAAVLDIARKLGLAPGSDRGLDGARNTSSQASIHLSGGMKHH
ncbi:MAG: AAA family ATPase [Chloroflexota bacterium]|nr:AAA family ATPase [Chloroflexota bacterium]